MDAIVSFVESNYVPVAIVAVALVGLLLFKMFFLKPVSMPGGPRRKREVRRGKWPEEKSSLDDGWTFLTAKRAHDFTESQYPLFPKLTGEPAGRQIWYHKDHKDYMEEKPKTGSMQNLLDLIGGEDDARSFSAAKNPNAGDKIFRQQMISNWKGKKPQKNDPKTAKEACRKGIEFYQMLQTEDGHWAGDYGGPMFLMPGLIICHYVTGTPLAAYKRDAMIAYLRNHQQTDGGWGTHIESASTMFGTVLSYVALRLLGVKAYDIGACRAREFIHEHGGALYTPSWGKFWLAILGAMEWDCINSVPPEMWLLPRWFPFHPGKLWCHCRMVYLPMCFVYGKRFTYPKAEQDPLITELRHEIYCQEYAAIKWGRHRQTVSKLDEYDPVGLLMRTLQSILAVYEKYIPFKLGRESALKFAFDYIEAEDRQTNYVDIGPVNKSLNMLCVWMERGSDAEEFQRHICRVDDYLWVAEDGMKMQGYNGSQCWDTSFAIQGIVESGLAEEFPEMCLKVYEYLDNTQIKTNEENREHWFRHISLGGWPFSTAAHGWPISDCTSEGLKGILSLNSLQFIKDSGKVLSDERMFQAANVLLSYQNHDGGWATYENNRGYGWYEYLNPSDVFGDIMIDYSYVECSTACISALSNFQKAYPEHRKDEIKNSIEQGRKFVKSIQRPDGSWYGSWGVCFTYATWFGIEGLVVSGEPIDSPSIKKACEFLVQHQNENGGWGESYLSCVDKAYAEDGAGELGNGKSGVVQTAWALLGLMEAHYPDRAVIDRGINYLRAQQNQIGDWAQEGITGVFNRNCGITYTAYRNIFPIWALGRYARLYENKD
mmetsp:Transcript_16150/g.21370  ORF Transcript_16150/g.21370 Transcript_16150/m.21370 type:complete len:826 (+) Transcript_16150:32-2509(+)